MEIKGSILLIDDNADVLKLNSRMLARNGYDVMIADSIAEANDVLSSRHADLIVLDILLPDGNGFDYLPKLREITTCPVIFLSSLSDNEDVVKGLLSGGDDYLSKPYDMNELLARIIAILRREKDFKKRSEHNRSSLKKVDHGLLSIDYVKMNATLHGKDVGLTPKEFIVLSILLDSKGTSISAEKIYNTAWGISANDDIRTVRQHISKIRDKLTAIDPDYISISTEYGKGYYLDFSD